MSNEELALALTEIAIKNKVLILGSKELPLESDGINPKFIEECASEITMFYRAVLNELAKK